MTIGQQVQNIWKVDAELHKWRRQGNNFLGTLMNVSNGILSNLEGKPYHIYSKEMYKYEIKRPGFIIVVTNGFKFKLPEEEEIKL